MSMYGADTAELRRLSAAFNAAADDLDREGGVMTNLLNNVSWIGDVAGRFLGNWTGVQLPQIGLSTRFLRDAADSLARNADQQEQASGAQGGSIGPVPSRPPVSQDGDADTELLDRLALLLDLIGIPVGFIDVVIDGLSIAQLEALLGFLTPDMLSVLKALDGVLDVAKVVVGLAQDLAAHPDLPMDERIVHALADVMIFYAIEKGVEAAITWGMTALGTAVPVIGNIALGTIGKIIGTGLGMLVGEGIDMLDNEFDMKENVADKVLDMYRVGKDVVGVAIDVIEGTVDVIQGGVDIAIDVAGDVVDAAGDVVGDVVGAVGGAAEYVFGGFF